MRVVLMAVLVLSQSLPGLPQSLPASGGLEVEARGGLVTIRAHRVPLSRILDRLAQQTGMKVTYEASPPSQPVTAVLEGLPPREAVLRLMEGMGVSYVFRTDASGTRVETLIVTDAGGGGSSSTLAAANTPPPPPEVVDYPQEVMEEPPDYEEPPPPDVAHPVPGAPGQPVPDLALPGHMGLPPGTVPGNPAPGMPGGPPPGYPDSPSFPFPVSNPFRQ